MSASLHRSAAPALGRAWSDDESWAAKLARDRAAAARHQSPDQGEITDTLLRRAVEVGAEAFALTGSTARERRTEISDLDYHVVGPRPRHTDLADEVDVYASDADRFWSKLRAGDDFVQWTLRFGLILFDTGIFRAATGAIATEELWPDAGAKLSGLPALRGLAWRLIGVGDRDAAQEQVRATLTSGARGLLLENGVFPLARRELPEQLRVIECAELAEALSATIYTDRSLAELDSDLACLSRFVPLGLVDSRVVGSSPVVRVRRSRRHR